MAERLSPAQIHLRKMSAALANAAETANLKDLPEYDRLLYVLSRHKRQLSDIQSMERRAELKKQILPDYLPWIEGALQTGSGKQDNILMTWLVWSIDCGEFHLALQIAEYAIFHDLRLPEPFTRTVGTLVAEEFADYAKSAQAAGKPFEVMYLQRVEEMVRDEDMPDESRARLLREIGLLLIENQPEQALAKLERALELNINIGVKGQVRQLRKQLGKPDDESQPDNAK